MGHSTYKENDKWLGEAGKAVTRYGLVLILLWFGIFKFTATEAKAIQPLISNSPLMAWLNAVLSVQGVSNLIGTVEIVTALLLATRPFAAKLAYWGALASTLIFATTLTFLFTTPGSLQRVEWMWLPDRFLFKDLIALGASLWLAAEARSGLPVGNTKQA